MKEYYEQLYANQLDDLHEMDKFLPNYQTQSKRNRQST